MTNMSNAVKQTIFWGP